MAVAISYVSESGDNYLSVYDTPLSVKRIVEMEKAAFEDEFCNLEVIQVYHNTNESFIPLLEEALTKEIEESV